MFRNGLRLLREPELGLRLYKNMVRARMFERRLIRLAQENKLQWPIYPSYGQEACGIGVSAAAAERDLFLLTLNYRVIPYVVGRNVGLQKYTDAFFHCLPAPDSREFFDKGFAPFSDSLGAHFGLALGWGLAFKSSGADRVCVCVFGDGAATRGTFHGAMNLSALLGLPKRTSIRSLLHVRFCRRRAALPIMPQATGCEAVLSTAMMFSRCAGA